MFYTVSLDALSKFSAAVVIDASNEDEAETKALAAVDTGTIPWHDENGRSVTTRLSRDNVIIDWIEEGEFGEALSIN